MAGFTVRALFTKEIIPNNPADIDISAKLVERGFPSVGLHVESLELAGIKFFSTAIQSW